MSAREFQSLLQSFLVDYLPRRRGYSPNTVASYRDAFVLLLCWFADERGIPAERLAMSDLGGTAASDFVGWMRESRGSSPGTCNNRLAAVKSFARFAQYEAPEHISTCCDILRTPQLKAPRQEMQWLSLQAVTALVEAASARGIRDLALVSLLYDCGMRASELCGMSVGSLFLGAPSSATVVGKGRKGRAIPLSPQVAKIAGDYTKACRAAAGPGDPLFVNRSGRAIGRAGVAYVVDAWRGWRMNPIRTSFRLTCTPTRSAIPRRCTFLRRGSTLFISATSSDMRAWLPPKSMQRRTRRRKGRR